MKRSIIVMAALTLLVMCIAGHQSYAQPAGYESWRDSELGITVTYPGSWTIDQRPETLNVPCVLEAPVAETAETTDHFGSFVMPVRIGEGYFDDISSLKDVWLDTVADDWLDLKVNSSRTIQTEQGYPAYEVDYSVTDRDDNRIRWLVWLVLTPQRKVAWVAAYCSKDSFEGNYQDAYGILLSMEFDD